jgi:hypothetical protein
MTIVRRFTCGLTGDKLVIVKNAFGKEVCITAKEAAEIQSNVEQDRRELEMERG